MADSFRPGLFSAILLVGVLTLASAYYGGRILLTRGLKAGAGQWNLAPSPDGRFQVVWYRYPRIYDVPETLGFGQGYVRLEEVSTGRVLGEKLADELSPLNSWRWTSNSLVVYDGPEREWATWSLPP